MTFNLMVRKCKSFKLKGKTKDWDFIEFRSNYDFELKGAFHDPTELRFTITMMSSHFSGPFVEGYEMLWNNKIDAKQS